MIQIIMYYLQIIIYEIIAREKKTVEITNDNFHLETPPMVLSHEITRILNNLLINFSDTLE